MLQQNDKMAGDVIFRPHSQDDCLFLTWLVHTQAYGNMNRLVVNITIEEHDKANVVQVGQKLVIKGQKDKYDDLDEIMARYIEPMNELVTDLVEHRKFLNLTKAGVDERLEKDFEASGRKSVPYYLHNYEKPGGPDDGEKESKTSVLHAALYFTLSWKYKKKRYRIKLASQLLTLQHARFCFTQN